MSKEELDQKVSSYNLIKDKEASGTCEIHVVRSRPQCLQHRPQLHSMKYA